MKDAKQIAGKQFNRYKTQQQDLPDALDQAMKNIASAKNDTPNKK